MGWEQRIKNKKENEDIEITYKEKEIKEIKEKKLKERMNRRNEKKEEIKNIDKKLYKSNINLLFLIYRPALFAIIGMLTMKVKENYDLTANLNIWPIVFFTVNIFTILLLLPIMHIQRINFRNLLKYYEKKFKWWQYILIVLLVFSVFILGSVIAEYAVYNSINEKTSLLFNVDYKLINYFLVILLPLSTIFAEDIFYFGYISNAVKNKLYNYILITIVAILQHSLFPFSFSIEFMAYRGISMVFLFTIYMIIYRKTKNLRPIILTHTVLNLITMLSIILN